MKRKIIVLLIIAAFILTACGGKGTSKAVLRMWVHTNNAFIAGYDATIAAYEAAHPDVDIIISWWDAAPLTDAVRAVMTAGQGAPDISTDVDLVNMVKAGYVRYVGLSEVGADTIRRARARVFSTTRKV